MKRDGQKREGAAAERGPGANGTGRERDGEQKPDGSSIRRPDGDWAPRRDGNRRSNEGRVDGRVGVRGQMQASGRVGEPMQPDPERGFAELRDEEAAPIPEEMWQAIIHNDASSDGRFIYAVRTTGIFCKPSCKSRVPNRANVRVFANAQQALDARFRPCKRCKPTGERLPDQEWVAQIKHCIETNYTDTLTLNVLADMCHGSPYHLHRTFKRITGMTPVEYVQRTRAAKAAELLLRTERPVADIALAVGLPSSAYFITLFKTITGQTPGEYRKTHNGSTIKEVLPSGSET